MKRVGDTKPNQVVSQGQKMYREIRQMKLGGKPTVPLGGAVPEAQVSVDPTLATEAQDEAQGEILGKCEAGGARVCSLTLCPCVWCVWCAGDARTWCLPPGEQVRL